MTSSSARTAPTGEILAKCYSAMHQMDESQLEGIMKGFLGGETLSYAEKIDYKDTKDLTENFILFGALAEIFARKSGFNRGLGGSMHTFFLPFGSYPNNAIVGGSAPHRERCGPLQAHQPQARHRHLQHR